MNKTRPTNPKPLLALLLYLILLSLNSLQAKLISAVITDALGKPVADVAVYDQQHRVYSKQDGSFQIKTEADSLTLSRLGYARKVVSTHTLPSHIVLTQKQIFLTPVRVTEKAYAGSTPALDSKTIYPDTDSKPLSTASLLLENSSFSSNDTRLLGEKQTLSLLGNLSRHTLVMLDGIPLNMAGEAFDLNRIPISQIDRIEIVKGNASVYGGSAAIGGIVNIYTRQQNPVPRLKLQQDASAGSFDLYKQRSAADYQRGGWGINSEYTHYTALNDYPYKVWWAEDSTLSRAHNRKTSDALFTRIRGGNAQTWLDYTLSHESYVRQLPGPTNFPALYDAARLRGYNHLQAIQFQAASREFLLTLSTWYQNDQSFYSNIDSSNPIHSNQFSQAAHTLGIKSRAQYQLPADRLELVSEYTKSDYSLSVAPSPLTGVAYCENSFAIRGDGDTYSDTSRYTGSKISSYTPAKTTNANGKRDNTAFSLIGDHQTELGWLEHRFNAALRTDISSAKEKYTWRVEQTLSCPAWTPLQAGYTIGTAYSLPSFYDLYWMGDSETVGNPTLKRETSSGSSLWLQYSIPVCNLKASYHHNAIADMIQWRQTYLFGQVWKPFNIGKAVLTSWELEAEIKPCQYLSLTAGATFTDARDMSPASDATYHKFLPYTPDRRLQASCSFSDSTKGISLMISHTGRQYSTPDNLIEPLPGFTLTDAAGYYKITFSRLELAINLKLNNLFDKQYEIYAYVPQPGFNWMSGLSLTYSF